MLNDLLNLSHVPCWTVTRMHRDQTVAEHCFRTAAIAAEICRRLDQSIEQTQRCVTYAIIHDGDETIGGDPPTPLKDALGHEKYNELKRALVPWLEQAFEKVPESVKAIVKVADVLERYTWWQLNGDRRFRHAWMGPTGPIKHNLDILWQTAREKAVIIGVDPSFMSNTVITDICCEILGGVVQIG